MNSINTSNENYYIELDLKGLFLKVKSYWYFILIGLLIGAALGVGNKMLFSDKYKASSMIYLRGANSSISLQDLQVGSELTSDYEIILKSRPNLEKVISKLNLKYTAQQLSEMISIANPENTRILKVEVTSGDPNLSKDIVNEVVSVGMDSIREIDSQEPYLVEKAISNNNSISISLEKSVVIGAILGVILTFLIITIKFIFSDNIQSIEDVEYTLGLPVLAVVVESKALSYEKKSTKSKRNKN